MNAKLKNLTQYIYISPFEVKLRKISFLLLFVVFNLNAQTTVTYTNNTAGALNSTTTSTAPLIRTFVVDENLEITDVNIRFTASHTYRGDLVATLTSPGGVVVTLFSNSNDANDNYDILLDNDSGGNLNDNNLDNTADPVDRTVLLSDLINFEGGLSKGTWTLRVWDAFPSSDNGNFIKSELIITGNNLCIPSANNPDSDGDGIADICDLDDDNDGILDATEGLCTSQQQTGSWVISGNTATYNYPANNGLRVVISTTTTNPGYINGNFNYTGSGNFWSPSLSGATSLDGTYNFGDVVTVKFQDQQGRAVKVLNPVLHIDRIGGSSGGLQNSAVATLQGGLTWTKISGTNDFLVTSTTAKDRGDNTATGTGYTAESTFNDSDGTAAGSLRINANVSEFSFSLPRGIATGTQDAIELIVSACLNSDIDGDSIPDYLDLDSDNDGCPDAIEGGAEIISSQLVNSAMSGGNTGATSGNYNQPIIQNLGNTVNTDAASASYGVPTIAGLGQSAGTAYNAQANSCIDKDQDGFPDDIDLDDDNDGILDSTELYCDTTTAPNVTYPTTNSPATTPSLYTKQLLFFDWSGVTLSPTSPSATKSVVYNGVTYTATISNYTSVGSGTPNTMVGNDILTWSGPSQMVGRYYNVNSTTFKEALYIPSTGFTGVNSFNVSVTASKGGVPYPVDFVFFDAETTNKSATQTEQIKFTNNSAGTIELLEKTGTGTIGATTDGVVNITGIGTNTVTLNETETSNVNALLFVKGYSPSVKVDITTSLGSQQGVGFAVRLYCDTDSDGIPNFLDLDSDGDGCPDAVEGSENVKNSQLNANGNIAVKADGVTTGTQTEIVSSSTLAKGVPELVNNLANNSSGAVGVADNTDGTADIGQGVGNSTNAAINDCRCYKSATNDANTYPTNHGITSLQRAGSNLPEAAPSGYYHQDNWPMVRQSAHTVLESKTKGFVVNRIPTTAQVNAIPNPIEGMMVYDEEADCLKININGTATGWKCFTTQGCPDN